MKNSFPGLGNIVYRAWKHCLQSLETLFSIQALRITGGAGQKRKPPTLVMDTTSKLLTVKHKLNELMEALPADNVYHRQVSATIGNIENAAGAVIKTAVEAMNLAEVSRLSELYWSSHQSYERMLVDIAPAMIPLADEMTSCIDSALQAKDVLLVLLEFAYVQEFWTDCKVSNKPFENLIAERWKECKIEARILRKHTANARAAAPVQVG